MHPTDPNPANPPKRDAAARGFTLLEMVAVVAIIGLLMTLVGGQIMERVRGAEVTAAQAKMTQVVQSLEMYRLDNGRYPTTEQGLQALVVKPSTPPEPRRYQPGGYVKGRDSIVDPWGTPFQYESPGQHNARGFDIWSLGADGQPGGDDNDRDFGNWDDEQVASN